MQHEPIDYEISELMKKATASVKEDNLDFAINFVSEALKKMKLSKLLYSPANYTKIIPYYQKAGRYSEVELFCLDILVPSVRVALQQAMSQRCQETLEVHLYQYISRIYDKLHLAAQRDDNPDDKARFIKEHNFYEAKWRELQPLAQIIELDKEFQEMKELFGADFTIWPNVIKDRFESFI
jgi:hypothetical protein